MNLKVIDELLNRIPRVSLLRTATPLHPCPRLSQALGGPEIWIKRDDCTPLAMGGNKARQLEFLLGDAQTQMADTVVHGAAVQSNYCRMLAAAGSSLGIDVSLLISTSVQDPVLQGNFLLDRIFGAHITLTDTPLGRNFEEEKRAMAERLRRTGRNVYTISFPLAEQLGALGYVRGATELFHQADEAGLTFEAIYMAGVGATQAGYVLTTQLLSVPIRIVGIQPIEWDFAVRSVIMETVIEASALMGMEMELLEDDIESRQEWVAPGYGRPSQSGFEAMTLVARTEGILLDPVYTSKAMAALINDIRSGVWKKGDCVVFLHTGGMPAIFAYASEIESYLESIEAGDEFVGSAD